MVFHAHAFDFLRWQAIDEEQRAYRDACCCKYQHLQRKILQSTPHLCCQALERICSPSLQPQLAPLLEEYQPACQRPLGALDLGPVHARLAMVGVQLLELGHGCIILDLLLCDARTKTVSP